MVTRSLTGTILVLLILSCLWLGVAPTLTLFAFLTVLSLTEFYRMFNEHPSIKVSWQMGSFIGLLSFGLLCSVSLGWLPLPYLFIILPVLFSNMLFELWKNEQNPIHNISIQLLGFTYIVLPFYLMVLLNSLSTHDAPFAIGMFLLIWTNDTFAYVSGRLFGKRKLFERISPNKTWEGTVGGGLLTILVATLLAFYYNDKQDLLFWIVSAILVVPCSVLGDLLESMFKRNLNLKDTGRLLPGHGGFLDRFDAALFTVPFYFVWVLFYAYSQDEWFGFLLF